MSCNFLWYELPTEIKKIGEELKSEISDSIYKEFKSINWFNLIGKINSIFKNLIADFELCTDITYSKFIWYTLNKKVETLCSLRDDILECNNTKFDVTANWDLALGESDITPVTDETSFIQYLINGDLGVINLTNIIVTNFSLVNGRLQCNLTANGTYLSINTMEVSEVKSIGKITGLTGLSIEGNPIATFNPIHNLPQTLINIFLGYNLFNIIGYKTSEDWAKRQPPFINNCTINFSGNQDSITGTNLEKILLTKNTTIQA